MEYRADHRFPLNAHDNINLYTRQKYEVTDYGPIVSQLPVNAPEAIESILTFPCRPRDIVKIHRPDPYEVDVVYFGDELDGYGRDEDDKEKARRRGKPPIREITQHVVTGLRNVVQEHFGPHWRVEQKIDRRRAIGRHPQRVRIRRVEAYRFRYVDEPMDEFKEHLEVEELLVEHNVKNLSDLHDKDVDVEVFA